MDADRFEPKQNAGLELPTKLDLSLLLLCQNVREYEQLSFVFVLFVCLFVFVWLVAFVRLLVLLFFPCCVHRPDRFSGSVRVY